MQISIESTGPLERQMTVKIPAERINSEVSSRLSRLSKTARIDGFRKGKVPLKIVERFYGSQVRQEVLAEVVRKSFYEVVSDEKLRVAADPEIEPIDTPEDQGFTYRATFEVYPEIQLTPIESLQLVQPACEITDADVSQMIDKLRQHAKHYHSKSDPAENGDRVTIDFTGTLDSRRH
jgi:trigger factor